jgi:hypothetical protein
VGSQEGRTPNVDAKFFDDLFFLLISAISSQSLLPSFVYIFSSSLFLLSARPLTQTRLNSSPLQPPGDHYDRVSGNAPKKNFLVKFPRGAQRFARGAQPPPPGECLNETVQIFFHIFFTAQILVKINTFAI